MSNFVSGNRVSVTKLRNGYFVGSMKGTVLEVNEITQKVKVETWQNGKRWYSMHNVKNN